MLFKIKECQTTLCPIKLIENLICYA